MVNAKSKISTFTGSISSSSSSPFSPSTASFSVVSLSGFVSGVESISCGVSPLSVSALAISAPFSREPASVAVTVNDTSTLSLSPTGIVLMVKVVGP